MWLPRPSGPGAGPQARCDEPYARTERAMSYEEVEISRDVEVVMIPQGVTTVLKAGTPAVITQSLGDSYTLQVPTFGGLYRLSGSNADAIGKAAARGDG